MGWLRRSMGRIPVLNMAVRHDMTHLLSRCVVTDNTCKKHNRVTFQRQTSVPFSSSFTTAKSVLEPVPEPSHSPLDEPERTMEPSSSTSMPNK